MDAYNEKQALSPVSPLNEAERSATIPTFRVVEISPLDDAEKPKPKVDKRLRFENVRNSFESDVSDFNSSVYDEPSGIKPTTTASTSVWNMGMLEVTTMAEVPGTATLSDNQCKWDESRGVDPSDFSSRLPHFHLYPRSALATPKTPRPPYKKRTRDGRIILVPQPEDTANDPHNWARWRREMSILCLASFSLFAGAMTSILAGGFGESSRLLEHFDRSSLDVGLTTAMLMIGLAVGHLIQTPTAILFGKRLMYLYSAWIFIFTVMWCAFSTSFPVLLVGRFFMGFALSPVEVLIPATLVELFPLHQRGRFLGIYLSFFLGSISLAPIVSAVIIKHLSWRWAFIVAALPATWSFFMILFLVPESYWDRTTHYMHTNQCIDTWSRSNAGKSIIESCSCATIAHGDHRIGKPIMYDGASPKRTDSHTLARRERVLAKLHLPSVARPEKLEKHLKVSDALRKSPARVTTTTTATTTATATAITTATTTATTTAMVSATATPMASYNTVDLSPAEAEFTLAQEGFEHPRPAPPTPRRRRVPPSPLGPRTDNQDSQQRPSYLRYVPSAIWPSRPHEAQPRSARTPKFNNTSFNGHATRTHLSPVVSPTNVTHHLSHLSVDGPHGRSSLSQEIHVVEDVSSLPPPSYDYHATHTSSQTTTSIINRRLSRPALRLNLDTVIFDGESKNGNPQWRKATISPGPPTSLPATPYLTTSPHPNQLSKPTVPLPPPRRTALYTERLRLPGRQPWTRSLRIWHGRLLTTQWRTLFLRPFLLALNPFLLWAALLYTLSTGLLAVLPRVVFVCFAGRWATASGWSGGTDFWDPKGAGLGGTQTGALSLATLGGTVVGGVLVGVLADVVAVRFARRNDGVFEPEFRLLAVVPGGMMVVAGGLGLGFAVESGAAWGVGLACLVLIGMGCAAGAMASVLYVLDSFTGEVAEAMVVLGVVKCLCHGVVFALVIDWWIDYRGVKEVFIVIAALHGFALLATVPVYVFGKRARAWNARRMLTR